MGEDEILAKLRGALVEDIADEYQVVFILSRIRKFLEFRNIKPKYKHLNFYCNWALHAKIGRTEPIADVLHELIRGTDEHMFLNFKPLVSDMKKFLISNDLPTKILDDNGNYLRFANLLANIYSDTPLEVSYEGRKIITIAKPKEPFKTGFTIPYTVT